MPGKKKAKKKAAKPKAKNGAKGSPGKAKAAKSASPAAPKEKAQAIEPGFLENQESCYRCRPHPVVIKAPP